MDSIKILAITVCGKSIPVEDFILELDNGQVQDGILELEYQVDCTLVNGRRAVFIDHISATIELTHSPDNLLYNKSCMMKRKRI